MLVVEHRGQPVGADQEDVAGLRHAWFLGTDDAGRVALYRGVPYELPFGVKLYSEQYSSPVQTEAYMNAAESLAAKTMLAPSTILPCDATKLADAAAEDACATVMRAMIGNAPSRDDVALLMLHRA